MFSPGDTFMIFLIKQVGDFEICKKKKALKRERTR